MSGQNIGLDQTGAEVIGPVIYNTLDKRAGDLYPTFRNGSTPGHRYDRYISGWDKLKTHYTSLRLVSAGVQLEFVGPDTNNSGTINCCVINNLDALTGDGISPNAENDWCSAILGATAWNAASSPSFGIKPEMIMNARTSFTGPAKYGAFYAYRPNDPIVPFSPVRQATSPPSGGAFYDEMLIIHANVLNDGSDTTANSVTKFRVKIVANYEGTVKDSTYPRPPENASPMDVYGLQCAVEAALATSRLGSLSNGPEATWSRLQNTGLSKFNEVVSLSQGR